MNGVGRKLQFVLSLGLLIAAVALIVVHVVLDAGPDKEAPDWIIYTATFTAVAATLVGTVWKPKA